MGRAPLSSPRTPSCSISRNPSRDRFQAATAGQRWPRAVDSDRTALAAPPPDAFVGRPRVRGGAPRRRRCLGRLRPNLAGRTLGYPSVSAHCERTSAGHRVARTRTRVHAVLAGAVRRGPQMPNPRWSLVPNHPPVKPRSHLPPRCPVHPLGRALLPADDGDAIGPLLPFRDPRSRASTDRYRRGRSIQSWVRVSSQRVRVRARPECERPGGASALSPGLGRPADLVVQATPLVVEYPPRY